MENMDSLFEDSDMLKVIYTGMEVFTIFKSNVNVELNYVVEQLEKNISERMKKELRIHEETKTNLFSLLADIRKKWRQCKREEKRFIKRYKDWLSTSLSLQAYVPKSTEILVKQTGSALEDTTFLKTNGSDSALDSNNDTSDVVDTEPLITEASTSCFSQMEVKHNYSADEALAFMILTEISKFQYKEIRKSLLIRGFDIYPSYKRISQSQALCYPPRPTIKITDNCVTVSLQALLDKTLKRILQINSETPFNLSGSNNLTLNCMCYVICDERECDQRNYKVFLMAIVPLTLRHCNVHSNKGDTIWENNTSSFAFRPIILQVLSSDQERFILHKEVMTEIKEQLKTLDIFKCTIDGKDICTAYHVQFAFTDDKFHNAGILSKNKNKQKFALKKLYDRICADLWKADDFCQEETNGLQRIFLWMMVASDPYISHLRISLKKRLNSSSSKANGCSRFDSEESSGDSE